MSVDIGLTKLYHIQAEVNFILNSYPVS
jgi:hypothetical protein